MSLKNTEFALGVVVYTGHETKLQMNTTKSRYKTSKMMEQTNKLIFAIFFVQLVLAGLAGSFGARWTENNLENQYLEFTTHYVPRKIMGHN
jgi:magnesium-transporting ATPase (P-type)